MTDRELMQDALDAMLAAIEAGDWHVDGACDPDLVIRRLQARLAQPEQKPVEMDNGKIAPPKNWGEVSREELIKRELEIAKRIANAELYTAPPQRKWKGLTYEEFNYAVDGLEDLEDCWTAIESALKEKNGF